MIPSVVSGWKPAAINAEVEAPKQMGLSQNAGLKDTES